MVQTFSESYFIAGEWDGTPGIAVSIESRTVCDVTDLQIVHGANGHHTSAGIDSDVGCL